MKKVRLLCTLFLVFGLFACSQEKEKTSSTQSESKAASKVTKNDAWEEKTQAYIKLGNQIMKFGMSHNSAMARFAAEAQARVQKGDFKSIRTDAHFFDDAFVKNLKAALAMPGATPEADATAKTLLAAIEKYMPNWKELGSYNKAKKFEDDQGAKGKAMLPLYLEGMAALNESVAAFNKQVDILAVQSHEKTLAKYKADGKLLEMHTLEALGAGRKLIEIFDDEADFKNAEKINTANAQLDIMEKNIDAMKVEYEKATSAKKLPTYDRYNSLIGNLNSMAGHYRESRKKSSEFNNAVNKYNQAVEDLNRMSR